MWTIKFRNGTMKRFKFPIRTTPEGSIEPFAGKADADISKIGDAGFFNLGGVQKPGNPDELLCK